MSTDITDAEEVVEVGTELERAPVAGTLFKTDDPVEIIEKASAIAGALKGVIDGQGLVVNIQGKAYPKVEAWTTLGSMLGVVPVCTWTRPVQGGWEARVEARKMDGTVVGAAEAQCTKAEKMWTKRDDYALRSMAQTRATSKALRGPLGFIVTLAGYEATPSEEMPTDLPRTSVAQATEALRIGPTAIKQLNDQLERYHKAGLDFDRLALHATSLGCEIDTAADNPWHACTRDQGKTLYEWMQAEMPGEAA